MDEDGPPEFNPRRPPPGYSWAGHRLIPLWRPPAQQLMHLYISNDLVQVILNALKLPAFLNEPGCMTEAPIPHINFSKIFKRTTFKLTLSWGASNVDHNGGNTSSEVNPHRQTPAIWVNNIPYCDNTDGGNTSSEVNPNYLTRPERVNNNRYRDNIDGGNTSSDVDPNYLTRPARVNNSHYRDNIDGGNTSSEVNPNHQTQPERATSSPYRDNIDGGNTSSEDNPNYLTRPERVKNSRYRDNIDGGNTSSDVDPNYLTRPARVNSRYRDNIDGGNTSSDVDPNYLTRPARVNYSRYRDNIDGGNTSSDVDPNYLTRPARVNSRYRDNIDGGNTSYEVNPNYLTRPARVNFSRYRDNIDDCKPPPGFANYQWARFFDAATEECKPPPGFENHPRAQYSNVASSSSTLFYDGGNSSSEFDPWRQTPAIWGNDTCYYDNSDEGKPPSGFANHHQAGYLDEATPSTSSYEYKPSPDLEKHYRALYLDEPTPSTSSYECKPPPGNHGNHHSARYLDVPKPSTSSYRHDPTVNEYGRRLPPDTFLTGRRNVKGVVYTETAMNCPPETTYVVFQDTETNSPPKTSNESVIETQEKSMSENVNHHFTVEEPLKELPTLISTCELLVYMLALYKDMCCVCYYNWQYCLNQYYMAIRLMDGNSDLMHNLLILSSQLVAPQQYQATELQPQTDEATTSSGRSSTMTVKERIVKSTNNIPIGTVRISKTAMASLRYGDDGIPEVSAVCTPEPDEISDTKSEDSNVTPSDNLPQSPFFNALEDMDLDISWDFVNNFEDPIIKKQPPRPSAPVPKNAGNFRPDRQVKRSPDSQYLSEVYFKPIRPPKFTSTCSKQEMPKLLEPGGWHSLTSLRENYFNLDNPENESSNGNNSSRATQSSNGYQRNPSVAKRYYLQIDFHGQMGQSMVHNIKSVFAGTSGFRQVIVRPHNISTMIIIEFTTNSRLQDGLKLIKHIIPPELILSTRTVVKEANKSI